jgi:hypothetical protein
MTLLAFESVGIAEIIYVVTVSTLFVTWLVIKDMQRDSDEGNNNDTKD